jgi:U3 small nucleolar RNA-associated protein 10
VYPPLILLLRSVRLADGPLLALLSALLSPSSGAEPTQRILTLLFILNDRQDWEGGLGQRACARLCKIKSLGNILISAIERFGFEDSVRVVVDALLDE